MPHDEDPPELEDIQRLGRCVMSGASAMADGQARVDGYLTGLAIFANAAEILELGADEAPY